MEDLSIEVLTERRPSDLRQPLERALAALFPAGLLESRWENDTLHLAGPGAVGSVALEEGRLVGRVRLEPPASLMRSVIEAKMTGLLEAVAAAEDDA